MSSRSQPLAAFALAALLAGVAIPLLGLVPRDETGPLCCRTGRCCCGGGSATQDSSCLRRACGCGPRDSGIVPAPLQLEATLAPGSLLSPRTHAASRAPSLRHIPLAGIHEPLTPPPKPPAAA